jgi:hypothetical protein
MNRVDLKSCAEGTLKGCDLNAASFECATRMRWVVRLLTLSLLNLTLAAPIAAEEVTALNEQEVLALFFERNLDLI